MACGDAQGLDSRVAASTDLRYAAQKARVEACYGRMARTTVDLENFGLLLGIEYRYCATGFTTSHQRRDRWCPTGQPRKRSMGAAPKFSPSEYSTITRLSAGLSASSSAAVSIPLATADPSPRIEVVVRSSTTCSADCSSSVAETDNGFTGEDDQPTSIPADRSGDVLLASAGGRDPRLERSCSRY